MLSTWPSRWKLRTRGRVRSLGALLTLCFFVVVAPDVCGRGDTCALGLILGFDEVLSPGIACDETFALLDGVLTLGFYEALSLEVMHEEPRVLFGRVACAWLPRGRLA